MRIKKEYIIKDIGGERVIIVQGRAGIDLTKIISFNSVAEWLWDSFSDRDFTENEVADFLVQKYEISAEIALTDAKQWIKQLLDAKLLEK
jgi:hypothetical protein